MTTSHIHFVVPIEIFKSPILCCDSTIPVIMYDKTLYCFLYVYYYIVIILNTVEHNNNKYNYIIVILQLYAYLCTQLLDNQIISLYIVHMHS